MESLQKRIDYLELQVVKKNQKIAQLEQRIEKLSGLGKKADLVKQIKDLKKANWALTVALDEARSS